VRFEIAEAILIFGVSSKGFDILNVIIKGDIGSPLDFFKGGNSRIKILAKLR